MGEYKEPEYIKQINKMLNMHNRITNFAMLNTNLDNYMNYQIQIIENNLNKWSTLQTRIDFVQPVLTPLYTVIKPYIYEQFSKVEEYSKIFGINEKFYLVSMYLGLWVPYVSDVLDYEFMIRIFDIVYTPN